MYIFAVHIRNFRRFDRPTIHPNPGLNFVLGPNNSGKTSLLRALDLTLNASYHPYREDLIGTFDFFRSRTDRRIEIWVHFKLAQNDASEIFARFGNRVSRWLLLDPVHLIEASDDDFSLTGLPFQAMTKTPLEAEPALADGKNTVELLAVRFTAVWKEESGVIDLEWAVIDEVGDPSSLSAEDRRAINFTLIPTQRDPMQMLGFTRRSLLGRLLDDSEISGPLRKLVQAIEESKTPLDKTESIATALESVGETLRELRLTEGGGRTTATVTFLRTEIHHLRSALELALRTVDAESEEESNGESVQVEQSQATEKEFTVPLGYQGDGVQNSLLLATMSESRAGSVQAIGAIEEPERSLEPWRARALVKRIAGAAVHQLFITTHSPAVLGEISPKSLLVLTSGEGQEVGVSPNPVTAIVGREINQPARKEFERCREAYSRCLFSRLVLIVEGTSEMGFLPTALASAAEVRGGPDLSTLGLEVMENYEGKRNMHLRSEHLKAFGKSAAILLDHDEDAKGEKTTDSRIAEAKGHAAAVLVWSRLSILDGAKGCDLEIMLAKEAPVDSLTLAIKSIYSEAEHELDSTKWTVAKKPLRSDHPLARQVPVDFPNPATYSFESLDEPVARLTLLCLMHGPHTLKSARDMRNLAEMLGTNVPKSVLNLYDSLRGILESPQANSGALCYDLYEGAKF